MNDTLMVIGEALIDFIPTEQGMALKDVCSFTKHCGGALSILQLPQQSWGHIPKY